MITVGLAVGSAASCLGIRWWSRGRRKRDEEEEKEKNSNEEENESEKKTINKDTVLTFKSLILFF